MKSEIIELAEDIGLTIDDLVQPDVINQIVNPLSNVWTVVNAHYDSLSRQPSVFCCCADMTKEEDILSDVNWLKHPSDFAPGFWQSSDEVSYMNGCDDGFSYIVAEQYFYTRDESQYLINPEFIMMFGLYRDAEGDYCTVDSCGSLIKAIAFSDNVVKVRTKLIMNYISAKQVLFVQFIDARYSSPGHYPHSAELMQSETINGENYRYSRWIQGKSNPDYLLSMIYARSIVRPEAVEKCGLWPFDDEEEDYPEFAIKELPDGTMQRYTCNPDKLADYFGSNPNAPHYLTPVFFKPEVLDKYRKLPNFSVSEYRLECGHQWGVEIDNVIPDRVALYLGDIGRDLPESERKYFLNYEIPPTDQRIAKETLERDFFNVWSKGTKAPVGRLSQARRNLNEQWEKRFSFPLFRELHEDDSDVEKLIRIPSGNGREEFDTVGLNLTKYLVDSLNEAELGHSEKRGGINKLEAYMEENNIMVDLSSFRDIQNIRSSSIAHAKGSNYEKIRGSLITDNKPADIEALINRLTETLADITEQIRA